MHHFEYHRPQSLKYAFELMEQSSGKARYIAGGTDLMVRIKQGLSQPEILISLRHIQELQGIELQGGNLVIKSMTLLRDIETNPLIQEHVPVLQQAAASLANVQIRNVATLGGNLVNASPAGDTIPPLLVLESELVLTGPQGERTIPVRDFFVGPGQTCLNPDEILQAVVISCEQGQRLSAFVKAGRTAKDLAVVNAAALLRMDGGICQVCRLAVGAVAPTVLRLEQAEDIIHGQNIRPELLDSVKDVVTKKVHPMSAIRSSDTYRRELAGALVKKSLQQAVGSPT